MFSLNPISGPMTGRTLVTVYGAGFTSTHVNSVRCMFGDIVRIPTTVNSTYVICFSPGMNASGPVEVSLLSTTGNPFAGETLSFDYEPEPWIDAVVPAYGHATHPFTLSVHGQDFLSTSDGVLCKFGDSPHSTYTYISSTEVLCTFTPQNTTSGEASRVELSSSNSVDFTDYRLIFLATNESDLQASNPYFGNVEGGTSVIVGGTGFQFTPNARFVIFYEQFLLLYFWSLELLYERKMTTVVACKVCGPHRCTHAHT